MSQSVETQAIPLQSHEAASSRVNEQAHLFASLAAGMATAMLVQVRSVQPGGVSGRSTVSAQPMVHQVDGAGNTVPHGIINNLPVFRLQGGANAVILDPAVGDIGIAVFASRDISAVKASRQPSQPGSARRFDWADGLYMGGFLNDAPTQFVEFSGAGIRLVSPVAVVIESPTLTHNGKNIGATHVHSGVETGGANTAPPV
ncbi:MAG: baseplate assembly protein [Roseomonas sp.]|nr:baseplate assembly protein [Roseomonas sp.]